MLLFLLALIIAALGVGVYAHYNTGVQDITLRSYHFAGVPDWTAPAIAAGAVLFLFLVQAIYAGIRIRMLKRANRRPSPFATSTTRTPSTTP